MLHAYEETVNSLNTYGDSAIFFGCYALFGASLPMGSLLLLLQNWTKVKTDMWRHMLLFQRPHPTTAAHTVQYTKRNVCHPILSPLIISYHHLISSIHIIIPYHHLVSSSRIIIPYHHLISSSHIIISYHHLISFLISSSHIIIPYHHLISSTHIIIL